MIREKPTPTREEVLETLRVDRAKAGLKQTKIRSGAALVALAMIFLGVWILLGNKIVISDEMKVLIVSAIGIGIVSAPYMIAFVKKLWNPPQVFVIRVNVTKKDIIRVFTGAPDLWDDVDIVSGEPYEFAVGNRMCYVVVDFEHTDDIPENPPEDHEHEELAKHVPDGANGYVATGSWLGEADDAEIVQDRNRIEENRRRNDVWARIGEKIYSNIEKIGRNAEHRHHKQLTDHSMESSLFNGGSGIKDEVMDAVPELRELEDGKTMVEIIEDEVDRQMEDLNTADNTSGASHGVSRDE